MPRIPSSILSRALALLRMARGWSQQELGKASGLGNQKICAFERGTRRKLKREQLEVLVACMGYGPEDVSLALVFLGSLAPEEPGADACFPGPTREDVRLARLMAGRIVQTEFSRQCDVLVSLAGARRVDLARQEAAQEWEAIRQQPRVRQRELVEGSPVRNLWALAELLCAESVRAAADDAAYALELAKSALRIAELTPGDPAWRSRLQGYSWAFVGNAQRVGNDFPEAVASFAKAWRLWRSGDAARTSPLPEWRLLDLEASMLREQRDFEAALRLLERALAAAPAEFHGRILLNKQVVLEESGEIEAALSTLEAARRALGDSEGEPRLHLSLRMSRLVLLCRSGRFDEANAGLAELRRLTVAMGKRLDLTRIQWLSGRIAAGLGRPAEAFTALEDARRDFADAGYGYDAALVSLELAILDIQAGRMAVAATRAESMVQIFRSQRVGRESLAALVLFSKAARSGSADVKTAQELLALLEQGRKRCQKARRAV